VPTNWIVAATDGKGEIFWRDLNTGTVMVWVVSGAQVAQSASLGALPITWMLTGVGDFDGNGSTDILWHDAVTGTVALWLMNGIQVQQVGSVAALTSNYWTVAETGDFDGDGKADILFRDNLGSGSGIWFMNGLQITSTVGIGPVGFDWTIQGLNAD
jgi:hypothetical protein